MCSTEIRNSKRTNEQAFKPSSSSRSPLQSLPSTIDPLPSTLSHATLGGQLTANYPTKRQSPRSLVTGGRRTLGVWRLGGWLAAAWLRGWRGWWLGAGRWDSVGRLRQCFSHAQASWRLELLIAGSWKMEIPRNPQGMEIVRAHCDLTSALRSTPLV